MIHWTWILKLVMAIGVSFCVGMMFRPIQRSGGGDFGEIFEFFARVFWLIPILLITTVYFMIMYFVK